MRRERTGRQTHSGELDRPWDSQTYSQTDRLKNKNRRTNRHTDCQGRTESGKNQGGRTDRQTGWVAHKQTERNDEITYQGTTFDSCISSKQSHWYCNQKSQIKVKIFFRNCIFKLFLSNSLSIEEDTSEQPFNNKLSSIFQIADFNSMLNLFHPWPSFFPLLSGVWPLSSTIRLLF